METRTSSSGAFVVWITGLSGTGKTTLALLLARELRKYQAAVEVLDGDEFRNHLCSDLGFSPEDRNENVRRIGRVAQNLSRNGIVAVVAAISPYRSAREDVRALFNHFVEIYMTCPLDVLVARDAKGLYRRAILGELTQFTGISAPYEEPLCPFLVIDSSQESPEDSVAKTLDKFARSGLISQQTFSVSHKPRREGPLGAG